MWSRDRIVIAYERVSTDEQDLNGRWPGAQVRRRPARLRAARRPEPGGVSASKLAIFDRPGGKELCDLITAGRVEAIYVDAQDRLCRDEAEWPVFRALCDASDTWIVVNMRPIPRDLGGKALSYFTALVAQQEIEEKKHRIRGKARVRAGKDSSTVADAGSGSGR